jgi:protein-disulfide isomerase
MRIWMAACVLLLLTACGAQPASVAQPAAPATATTTLLATVAPATAGPVATAPVSTATAKASVAPATAPVTPAAVRATTAAPELAEYTADNGDRVLGKPGAPITMLDYSDFQ